MPETKTIRAKDPADGKLYDYTLNETSRTLKTSASSSIALIRDRILGAAANQFTNAEATVIAQVAVIRMQEESLLV